jgi:hypothetical protein
MAEIKRLSMQNSYIFATANAAGLLMDSKLVKAEPAEVGRGNYGAAGKFQRIRQREEY